MDHPRTDTAAPAQKITDYWTEGVIVGSTVGLILTAGVTLTVDVAVGATAADGVAVFPRLTGATFFMRLDTGSNRMASFASV